MMLQLNQLSQPHQNLGDELWGICLSAHQILAKLVHRNAHYGFLKSGPIFPKKRLVLVRIWFGFVIFVNFLYLVPRSLHIKLCGPRSMR